MRFLSSAQFIERSEVADEFVAPSAALANHLLAGKGLGRLPPCSVSYFVEELHRPGAAIGLHTRGTANIDTGGEFISRRIDEPIRRMIGGIQDPSCCL
jgi:hypothetical protein